MSRCHSAILLLPLGIGEDGPRVSQCTFAVRFATEGLVWMAPSTCSNLGSGLGCGQSGALLASLLFQRSGFVRTRMSLLKCCFRSGLLRCSYRTPPSTNRFAAKAKSGVDQRVSAMALPRPDIAKPALSLCNPTEPGIGRSAADATWLFGSRELAACRISTLRFAKLDPSHYLQHGRGIEVHSTKRCD
jgi:hypothetical protein